MVHKAVHYTVYKITNLLNGMIYIGKHKTENLNDSYMGSSKWLKSSIEKHGIENYKKEILFDFKTREEMDLKERELVNEEFVQRKDTYNLNTGGRGGWFACNSSGLNNKKDQYKIMHERLVTDPEFREEFKKKVSRGRREFFKRNPDYESGEKNPMYGRQHTESARKRMSETHFGEANGSYGTRWITNEKLKMTRKLGRGEKLPKGWKFGRKKY